MARERLGGGQASSSIYEAENMLHGALRGRDADASMGEHRARSSAWWSLGCGLLWLGGFLSIVAILLGIGALIGLRSAAVRGAPVWAACGGLVLGVAGIVLSVLLAT